MRARQRLVLRILLLCLMVPGWGQVKTGPAAASPKITPDLLGGLAWRSIGPAVFGGRITDVAGVAGNPNILYAAHADAGLFKSTNGGTTFESIFDDGSTTSIGAVALAPDNPEVIYVGTGEGTVRNSVSFGDGIYKSLDGGKTWKNLGLKETERFSRIIVNPLNPDVVFAAAMGHEWGPNKARGVYRSTDGGATWKNVLFTNDTTGASEICFDSKNPNIIYAGMYDYLRRPWHFRSGGPGGGLFRSSDGGETWRKLTDPGLKNGLPGKGLVGRIGLAVSPSNPRVVYAMIESEEPGELWRSDDRGATWRMVSDDRNINYRPFYFSVIRVDPADENRIYALCRSLFVSSDGGKTFSEIGYWKIFGDLHAIWIDPANPLRVLNGTDGGFYVSNDRGTTWDFLNILPLAQPYHVAVDMADPYNVLGGFQDHEVWRGPNEKWNLMGVKGGDWTRFRGHGDGMWVLADPRDPNIIYYNCENGDFTRFDLRTGEERFGQPYPVAPSGLGGNARLYRFNWNSPIHMSPTNPDVIYFGGNVLFKTTDGGHSWRKISPDLTTNDREKMKLSGGITPDNTGAEIYCTILSIAESPRDTNTIWVGTDDGNLQLTRDGGQTWANVAGNINGLPAAAWISSACASWREAGTAYVSVDQHRLDDFASYLYRTADFGKTWERIDQGLRGYVHVVVEDPKEPNLLYAGTELGVFASFDRGASWTDLRLGLPALSVMDLKVHPRDNDLVIASHARGFYILDDVTPLQQLARGVGDKVALFKPLRATRYTPVSDASSFGGRVFLAKNKPYGALISYYLEDAPGPGEVVKLEVLDSSGRLLRVLDGPRRRGLNRVVWGLRERPVANFEEVLDESWFNPRVDGPRVLPGEYTIRLSASGRAHEQSFEVRLDPRMKVSPEDLAAHYQAVTRLARMQFQVNETLSRIQSAAAQISRLQRLLSEPALRGQSDAVMKELDAVRVEIRPDWRAPEHLNLESKISAMRQEVEGFTGRPTAAQAEWLETFDKQLGEQLGRLAAVVEGSLAKLNSRLREAGIPHIIVRGNSPAE